MLVAKNKINALGATNTTARSPLPAARNTPDGDGGIARVCALLPLLPLRVRGDGDGDGDGGAAGLVSAARNAGALGGV